MKQIVFLIILIVFQCINSLGQSKKDSISISNKKGDIKCYQNGILLTDLDYNVVFKDNSNALKEIKLARSNYKTGKIFGYIGGFVFGFCLGSAISGEKIDYTWWWTLGSSAAVAGTGLIIYNSGKKHHIKAIREYNSSFLSHTDEFQLKIGFKNDGLNFVFNF